MSKAALVIQRMVVRWAARHRRQLHYRWPRRMHLEYWCFKRYPSVSSLQCAKEAVTALLDHTMLMHDIVTERTMRAIARDVLEGVWEAHERNELQRYNAAIKIQVAAHQINYHEQSKQ